MIEGPRTPAPEELPGVSDVCDTVFFAHLPRGEMFRRYPYAFSEANRHNLFVCLDEGKVVSHVAMQVRDAVVDSAPHRVACIGAVCTYDAHRGQQLASRLLESARTQALEDRATLMYISGGRGLYRRMGAQDATAGWTATITRERADALRTPQLTFRRFRDEDIPMCDGWYRTRTSHFARIPNDWMDIVSSGMCMDRPTTIDLVLSNGEPSAYLAADTTPDEKGRVIIQEAAGDPDAIIGALRELTDIKQASEVELWIDNGAECLRAACETHGIALAQRPFPGTILSLTGDPLPECMPPYGLNFL